MKKILRRHSNTILAFFAIVFSALVIGYFIWGVGYIIFEVNAANHSQATFQQSDGFDLKTAAALDYRGLLPAATSSE